MKHKHLLKKLQLKMLRIQQGVWHSKKRVIIALEGFDAAGKGGAIRRITANLDPRGITVYPIGVPLPEDQGKHWLYRFWTRLPAKGQMVIFDRTWYGRVLVERVDKLTSPQNWKRGYKEINQFEKLLTDDGVHVIKIFLKISKGEQLKRFEERLKDPYKQWKITEDDIKNRSQWVAYERAVMDMLKKTNSKNAPWHVVNSDDKEKAREMVLKIITDELKSIENWMETNKAKKPRHQELQKALKNLS